MKKTGLEIVEMIAKGETPKKIKNKYNDLLMWNSVCKRYEFEIDGPTCLDLLDVLNEEFEIIEEEKVWKPKKDDVYYIICDDDNVAYCYWQNDEYDWQHYELGNFFRTEEEAQKQQEKIKIYMKLKRYALDHNTEKIDWSNEEQERWTFNYDYKYDDLRMEWGSDTKKMGAIYFTSEKIMDDAIEEIGDENIKKLFREE